jgi:transposase, IS30 family
MVQRGRPGLSPRKKDEVWQRWRSGESYSEIGRAVGKALDQFMVCYSSTVV